MSKIAYDSLLTAALGRELSERLSGAPVRGLKLDAETQRLEVETPAGTLLWDLRADGGAFVIERVRVHGPTVLPGGARIGAIGARKDERTLEIEILTADSTWGRLVIELGGTARNAILTTEDGRIAAVLTERRRGARPLTPGGTFATRPAPQRADNEGMDADAWRALLRDHADLRDRLLRDVAWTSPLNVEWLLAARDPDAMRERWLELIDPANWSPCLLDGIQPYVHRLGTDAERYPSLLGAMKALEVGLVRPRDEALKDEALMELERRLQRTRKRIERLESDAAVAQHEANDLRQQATLLLAQAGRVPRGATRVELDDFAGGTITVTLDPARDAAANANELFARAKRRARAAERLPELLARARAEIERIEATIRAVAEGRTKPEAVIGPAAPSGRRKVATAASLPYRRFMTTGGLEVRVGRNAKTNDELTLRHARPSDIWLHARADAGAHVVLRWSDPEANPPHRDLVEAAVLAAVHSRARTAGTVPVDWTRRKYVRKPRRSPAGRVTIERAKTLFVEPSETLVEKLRADPD